MPTQGVAAYLGAYYSDWFLYITFLRFKRSVAAFKVNFLDRVSHEYNGGREREKGIQELWTGQQGLGEIDR